MSSAALIAHTALPRTWTTQELVLPQAYLQQKSRVAARSSLPTSAGAAQKPPSAAQALLATGEGYLGQALHSVKGLAQWADETALRPMEAAFYGADNRLSDGQWARYADAPNAPERLKQAKARFERYEHALNTGVARLGQLKPTALKAKLSAWTEPQALTQAAQGLKDGAWQMLRSQAQAIDQQARRAQGAWDALIDTVAEAKAKPQRSHFVQIGAGSATLSLALAGIVLPNGRKLDAAPYQVPSIAPGEVWPKKGSQVTAYLDTDGRVYKEVNATMPYWVDTQFMGNVTLPTVGERDTIARALVSHQNALAAQLPPGAQARLTHHGGGVFSQAHVAGIHPLQVSNPADLALIEPQALGHFFKAQAYVQSRFGSRAVIEPVRFSYIDEPYVFTSDFGNRNMLYVPSQKQLVLIDPLSIWPISEVLRFDHALRQSSAIKR